MQQVSEHLIVVRRNDLYDYFKAIEKIDMLDVQTPYWKEYRTGIAQNGGAVVFVDDGDAKVKFLSVYKFIPGARRGEIWNMEDFKDIAVTSLI